MQSTSFHVHLRDLSFVIFSPSRHRQGLELCRSCKSRMFRPATRNFLVLVSSRHRNRRKGLCRLNLRLNIYSKGPQGKTAPQEGVGCMATQGYNGALPSQSRILWSGLQAVTKHRKLYSRNSSVRTECIVWIQRRTYLYRYDRGTQSERYCGKKSFTVGYHSTIGLNRSI